MIVLLCVVLSGHVIRLVQAGSPPFDERPMAEMDSLFHVLSERADSADGVAGNVTMDTLHTGFGATYDHVPIRQAGIESWVLVDTLEKPKASFPIAINTADARTLQALPRIGPAMAQRILDHRSENGHFRSGNDLLAIRGIGSKTLEKLLPLITFEVPTDSSNGL